MRSHVEKGKYYIYKADGSLLFPAWPYDSKGKAQFVLDELIEIDRAKHENCHIAKA